MKTTSFFAPDTQGQMYEIELAGGTLDELIPNGVNEKNFMDCTVANFSEVTVDTFIPDYISESGSEYMFANGGVYRKSDHWGYQIASCIWLINSAEVNAEKIGFCKFSNFTKYGYKNRNHAAAYGRKQVSNYWEIQDAIINFLVQGNAMVSVMNAVFNII